MGCRNVIHFNNAGAALMPKTVSDTLYEYLKKEEWYGGYETAEREAALLNDFYQQAAVLLNCSPGEIAFIENATRAWDMAFYSLKFKEGDRILTTVSEYGSNVIAYLQQKRRYNIEVVFIPDDQYGQIDLRKLETGIDHRVKLITISHVPTGDGLVNPVMEIGRIARRNNIPFLLDSCQAVGQLPIDVQQIGCDMLSGTGRKYLRGPRGTGFLYVKKDLIPRLDPPFLDQHAATLLSEEQYEIRKDARRFENWECYFAGKAALGKAIEYALSWGMEQIQERIYLLAGLLREGLSHLKGVSVEDQGKEQCGIVTFQTRQLPAMALKKELAARGMNIAVSEGSGNLVSYRRRNIKSLIRASLHYYNTEEEIRLFLKALNQILKNS